MLCSLATSAIGCGDDGGADAGPADVGVSVDPAAPDIPWLDLGVPPVAITPCPDGWHEEAGDVTTCAPYLPAGPDACAVGEAHFPGEPGCRPIGDPCPAGTFADTLPTDGPVVYVDAAAAPGGDGSLASPYAALNEVGWLSLAAGTTVALARGVYPGTVPLKAGVRVVGACVAETHLVGVDAPVLGVVTVTSAGEPAELRNVAIEGASQGGVYVDLGHAITLDGVAIDGVTRVGIGGTDAGSVIHATNVVVRATRADAGAARGIEVVDGAAFEGAHLVVTDNPEVGMVASGGSLVASDALIGGGSQRQGVAAQIDADVTITRVLLMDNRELGLLVIGATATLAESVVRGTSPVGTGRAINAQEGATLNASRVLVTNNQDTAIGVIQPGTVAVLTDLVVKDTESHPTSGLYGDGIEVTDGAHVEATRLLLSRNQAFGMAIHGEGTEAIVTDAVVQDTQAQQADARFGRGIAVEAMAHLTATRMLVSGNHDVGLGTSGLGTEAMLTDVVIRDSLPREVDHAFGYGLAAQFGSQIVGERVVVDAARGSGLWAAANASVTLEDISISDVRTAECDCPDYMVGMGVTVAVATVTLTDFVIRDVATCGVFLSDSTIVTGPTALDLERGRIARSTIGACVQVDGYDLMRLGQEVVYEDNGVNLDTTMLAVPTVPDSLSEEP